MDQYLLQWTHLVHVELTLTTRELSEAGGELPDKIMTEAQRTTMRLLLSVMMKIDDLNVLWSVFVTARHFTTELTAPQEARGKFCHYVIKEKCNLTRLSAFRVYQMCT